MGLWDLVEVITMLGMRKREFIEGRKRGGSGKGTRRVSCMAVGGEKLGQVDPQNSWDQAVMAGNTRVIRYNMVFLDRY